MVICGAGAISIVVVLGLAMLKVIVLPGDSALLLVMLMITLFACVPSISMYGTYKYAECLNSDLARIINEWLQAIETIDTYEKQNRGGE
jgi:ABC-type transport system involved in cytochrome bd biosynthesis fused ATPase/permease subunit